MKIPRLIFFVLTWPGLAAAAVIGTNTPSLPVTAERVANLPEWKNYLEVSVRQYQADKRLLRAEMKAQGLKESIEPPKTSSTKLVALDRTKSWYGGADARRIAENVASFQTPSGGWSKNSDFATHRRAPGEGFAANNSSKLAATNDFDPASGDNWSYIGTFDNDATTTELRFIAKVIAANGTNNPALTRAFFHGVDFIFAAQFPNGGWPQVWPLQGGYHDGVTFNDGAMVHVIEFLRDVAGGQNEFSFVPENVRTKAVASWKRGVDCILAAQIIENGNQTIWCQQHDALTLLPTSARNYEMPCLTSSESAEIVLFLMKLPEPSPREVLAVHAAVAWFEKTKIMDQAFKSSGNDGRKLLAAPGEGPIWARYYEIGTDKPVFGDRDKTIHDDVNEISKERRQGYAWFKDTGKRVLEHYPKWAKLHPQST